jgi:hypothetical protein
MVNKIFFLYQQPCPNSITPLVLYPPQIVYWLGIRDVDGTVILVQYFYFKYQVPRVHVLFIFRDILMQISVLKNTFSQIFWLVNYW